MGDPRRRRGTSSLYYDPRPGCTSEGSARKSGMSRFAFVAMLPFLFVALLAAAAAHAADDKPLSFAFAAQAGSGVYSIEGRVVQIYRIPIGFTIRTLQDDRVWGAEVTLPLTFGFY